MILKRCQTILNISMNKDTTKITNKKIRALKLLMY